MKKKEYQEFDVNLDSIPDQFKVLEEKVEQLVQKCNELQNAKSGLETRVADLQESLNAKDVTEKNYLEEKSLIRSKMDDLVGRLDRILESN
jgi:chromosome segregation ATPase